MPKHTTGVWRWQSKPDKSYEVVAEQEGQTIVIATLPTYPDARLTAAGPALLAAVKAATMHAQAPEWPPEIRDALYAALAEAE